MKVTLVASFAIKTTVTHHRVPVQIFASVQTLGNDYLAYRRA